MLRWQQAEGFRHALDAPFSPRPGESFTTLCGLQVTGQPKDFPQIGGHWFDPTCAACNAKWLARR